jgi:hypothetical protein
MPQVSHLGEAPGRKPGTHLVSSSRPKRQRTVIEVTDSTSHWQYKSTCNRSLESSRYRKYETLCRLGIASPEAECTTGLIASTESWTVPENGLLSCAF